MLNFGASKPRVRGGPGPRGPPPWIRTWNRYPVLATERHYQGGPFTLRSHVWGGVSVLWGSTSGVGGMGPASGGSLYGEVQCIIGNGHMGWENYLLVTSFVGGKIQTVLSMTARVGLFIACLQRDFHIPLCFATKALFVFCLCLRITI